MMRTRRLFLFMAAVAAATPAVVRHPDLAQLLPDELGWTTLAYVTNWSTRWGWRKVTAHPDFYAGADVVKPNLGEALRYVGRARSSSPSEGSSAWHQLNQKVLVERAYDLDSHSAEASVVLSKQVRALTGSKP